MEYLRIWATTIVFAMTYGIAHDQVTARVCVEYFTVGHAPLIATESPTLLAFGWGILATWWVGAIMGVFLALAARAGSRPPLKVADLVRPAAVLLGMMAVASFVAGIAGYTMARLGFVSLSGYLAENVPARSHDRFFADWWAHMAAYATGGVGAIGLCAWIYFVRRPPAPASVSGETATSRSHSDALR